MKKNTSSAKEKGSEEKQRRMTSQRVVILEYLKKTRTHPTAEEVYVNVKKVLPAITLATVYRNLHVLADEGLITRMVINKEYHFDAFGESHQHIVCPKCGKISDLQDEKLERCLREAIKRNKGESARTIIFRLCERCEK